MPAPPESLEIYLDDAAGNRWHISGGDFAGQEGVRLASEPLGTAFEDMYESPREAIYNSTAFEIGGRYGGLREHMFEFCLAFNVRSTADTPWRVVESRLRKALSYTVDSRITCKIVGQSTRYLTIRMQKTPKLKTISDPNERRYALVLYYFVGAYPRWVEDDYTMSWTCVTDTTGSGTENGSVVVSNPTDNEQWMKWVAQAGNAGIIWTLPDFSWGDNRFQRATADASRMIIMPALLNGENIVVDTDEMTMAGQVNSSLDTAVYMRMNSVQFLYPIPPYTPPTTIPVSVQKALPGNGVQVRVPRSWSRPWGLE